MAQLEADRRTISTPAKWGHHLAKTQPLASHQITFPQWHACTSTQRKKGCVQGDLRAQPKDRSVWPGYTRLALLAWMTVSHHGTKWVACVHKMSTGWSRDPLNIALMKESTIKLRVGICLFWRSIISGCDLSADYALANELCQAFR